MEKKVLRQVQLTQLEMAKEIKRICAELEINYFLDFGTLLGAVWHKGFIPWDDDLDIGMLRKDYEKFIMQAPNILNEKFFLQTWYSDKSYNLPFAKLRKKNTVFIENSAENSGAHCGIFIDIFPYDVFPDSKKKQKWQGLRYYIYRRLLLIKGGYSPWVFSKGIKKVFKFLIYKSAYILVSFTSREKLISNYMDLATKYNSETSICYYEQGADNYNLAAVDRKYLDTLSSVEFEKEVFSSPCDVDKYLTRLYGDYMVLPPEKERENRHKILKVEL